jgi:hypothetical protein
MSHANDLRNLQQWFAGIVEHPRTADVALRSRAANQLIPRADVTAGRVIAPNPRMDAAAMLQVYNGAYLSRLVEVLQGDFGALQHVLGEHGFHQLIARYLASFPSRHPNLNQLGRNLPAFVRRQKQLPQRAFATELATLERACAVAFDAPEFEPLAADALAAVPQERWPGARFTPNPSLQLFAFRFPVDQFYQPWKEDRPEAVPAARRSWLAGYRTQHRVWRQRLTRSAHAVLKALVDGRPLGEALGRAANGEPVAKWFQDFAADGFFIDLSFET